ncbi:MAG: hypothetical protein JRJ65_20760 [Deltaproteobacteria bacterium]|nr:hypothetical protein [Deltaproteobacteria bacterium]
MNVEKDFREFIALLNGHDVRYLIIGGFAFSFYAEPRYTKDIDILIENSHENADNLIKALQVFGFTDTALSQKDFLESGQVIQLGVAPVRIDILTSIKGIDFRNLWKNRVAGRYGDIKVWFISKNDLIRIKRISGRKQDIADIEKLEKI